MIHVTNTPPLALPDQYFTHQGVTISVDPTDGILANDADADGDPLTISISSDVTNGRLTLAADGSFTYIPNPGFAGADRFEYTVSDGKATTDPVPVDILVDNVPPVPVEDQYQLLHDQSFTVTADQGVLANDSDPDGDALTSTMSALTTNPQSGTLTLRSDGSFDYVPNSHFVGIDSFTYVVSDGVVTSSPTLVTLDVTNQAPVSSDDDYSVAHGQVLNVAAAQGVLANDFDADGDDLAITVQTPVAHGTLMWQAGGGFIYTPDGAFSGQDSFTYVISDGVATSQVATVTLNVTNDPTAAANAAYQLGHDTTLHVAAPGFLENVLNPDGDPLTIEVINPSNGNLTYGADGSFTYVPNAGFVGADQFDYRLSDGVSTSDYAIVHLKVQDSAPAAVADSYSFVHDQTVSVSAAAGLLRNDRDPDGDSFTIRSVTQPSHGGLLSNPDGSFAYFPQSGYVGQTSFTYVISDGALSSTGTVSLKITNHAPVAQSDAFTLSHDRTFAGNVLANDSDADGDSISSAVVAGGGVSHGSLSFHSDGTFTYTPQSGFVGNDSFTYTLWDGAATSTTATALLVVRNQTPTAQSDAYGTGAGQTLTISASNGVLANDTDNDGDTMSAQVVSDVSHGTLTLSPDGSFVFVPAPGFTGTDSFVYQVSDGLATSANQTVTLHVGSDPAAPDRSFEVGVGNTLSQRLLCGFGGGLTATRSASPTHGTLILNADGSYAYVPSAGFVGTDSFSYVVSNGTTASSAGTVTIAVNDDALWTAPNAYTILHDTTLTVCAANGVLANDSGASTGTLTATIVDDGVHGHATLNPDGSFTYTPSLHFTGTDSFTYKEFDGVVHSSPVTVTINVFDNEPTANNDAYTAPHDQTLSVIAANGVMQNDFDDAGDSPIAVLVQNAANGTVTLHPDGSFTYVPLAHFVGADSFQYKLDDGVEQSPVATATIQVWNNAPISIADTYLVHHLSDLDESARFGVLGNDTDDPGDVLTAAPVGGPAHGHVTLSTDGSFVYRSDGFGSNPSAQQQLLDFGVAPFDTLVTATTITDSFTYRANDGVADGPETTVSLTVWDIAPVAEDDTFRINHGATLSKSGIDGLLGNDYDQDGDAITFVQILQGPQHAQQFTTNALGGFTYVPNPTFVGVDTFTYVISDGDLRSTATAWIQVLDKAPTATDDSYQVHHDGTLTNSAGNGLLQNDFDGDGDPLTLQVVDQPLHGSVAVQQDGSFVYTPDAGYVGGDRFTYKTNDGALDSGLATATISVWNNVPSGHGNNYYVFHGQPLSVSVGDGVLSDDLDWDGDTMSAVMVTGPASASSFVLNSDGSFQYVPNPSFTGTDSFTYKAFDGVQSSATYTVTIDVRDARPYAYDNYYRVKQNQQPLVESVANGVLSDDWDPDNRSSTQDSLSAVLVGAPIPGLVLNPNGSFTYTSDSTFTGRITFQYQATDRVLTSDPATVTIDLTDEAPFGIDDCYSVSHKSTLNGNVLDNDRDGDDDKSSLTATIVSGPTVQTGFTFDSSSGRFTYTPNNSTLTDSFTYRLSDGVKTTGPFTVNIDILNDPPVGFGDYYAVGVNNTLTISDPSKGVLANDVDADQDSLRVKPIDAGKTTSHGTLTMNSSSDGTFTYVPDKNFHGIDTFYYRATDGFDGGNSDTGDILVSIDVRPYPTTAVPESYRTPTQNGGTVVSLGNVLTNDQTQNPNGTLQAAIVTPPQNGTLTLSSSGDVQYRPVGGFAGTDSFTYQIVGTTAQVTDTITVFDLQSEDDRFQIGRNRTLTGNVTSNDTGTRLRAILGNNVAHGVLRLFADGEFTYQPTAGYVGTDTFTYDLSDGSETTDEAATVTIDVTDSAPTGPAGEAFSVSNDQELNIGPKQGLLAEASDADGDSLTAEKTEEPSHGDLTLREDGTFTYEPDPGFVGTDTFQYDIDDSSKQSAPITVTIDVEAPDDPSASDQGYSTLHDHTLTVGAAAGLLASDDYGVHAVVVAEPTEGTVTLQPSGAFIYVPAEDFVGEVTFTYAVVDEAGERSAPATVRIDVTNTTPLVGNIGDPSDEQSVPYVVPINGTISANDDTLYGLLQRDRNSNRDFDIDGDPLTAAAVLTTEGQPQYGTVSINPDGTFTYHNTSAPSEEDHPGSFLDQFSYTVSDGIATSSPAMVWITVQRMPDGVGTQHSPLLPGDTYYASDGTVRATNNSSTGVIMVESASDGSVTVEAYGGGSDYYVAVVGMHHYAGNLTWSGAVSGNLTLIASGTVNEAIAAGNVVVSADHGIIGDVSGANVIINSGRGVGDVTATGNVSISAGDGPQDDIGNVSATGDITNLQGGGRVGTVSAGGNIGSVFLGSLDSNLTAGGYVRDVVITEDISGDIVSSGGDVGTDDGTELWGIHAGGDITGSIHAGHDIGGVTAGSEISDGSLIAGNDIDSVTADTDISGESISAGGGISSIAAGSSINDDTVIAAVGHIGSITSSWDVDATITASSIVDVEAVRDLSGSIEADGLINTVVAGRALAADVDASSLDNVQAESGSGDLHAHTEIGTVVISEDMSGDVAASGIISGGAIGSLSVGESMSGDVTTGGNLQELDVGSDLSGSVTAGDIDSIFVGGDDSKSVASHGHIGDLNVGGDLSGDVTAEGDIGVDSDHPTGVEADGDISGDITSSDGEIVHVISETGDISGTISTRGVGDIGVVSARGDVSGDIISGGAIDSITAGAATDGGSITSSNIDAVGDIGTIAAHGWDEDGGDIEVDSINSSDGSISTITSTGQISGEIHAKDDIGTVDAEGSGDDSSAGISGSIRTDDGSIGEVTAEDAGISSEIEAGSYIGDVTAAEDVSGDIEAHSAPEGSSSAIRSVTSRYGSIESAITTSEDGIGSILAGADITNTIDSADGIGSIIAGDAVGGDISGDVTAGGAIGNIEARWNEGLHSDTVFSQDLASISADIPPVEGAQSEVSEGPRPAAPDWVTSGGAGGNISGRIQAAALGTVNAYDDIQGDIVSATTLASVWARNNIAGNITSSSGFTVDSWNQITGDIQASGPLTIRAYNGTTGSIDDLAGTISLVSWGNISGSVRASDNVGMWAYASASATVRSTNGGIIADGVQRLSGSLEARRNIIAGSARIEIDRVQSQQGSINAVGWGAMIAKQWEAFKGNVLLASEGNIDTGNISGKIVTIFAGGNIVGGATATDGALLMTAIGNIEGAYAASAGSISVQSANFNGSLTGSSDVHLEAWGNVTGSLTAGSGLDIWSYGNMNGTFAANNGTLQVKSFGDIKGTLQGKNGVAVETWGSIDAGTIQSQSGAIDLNATHGLKAQVISANGFVQAKSWGDLQATVTSQQGYVTLFSAGNMTANVIATGDVGIESWGTVEANVNAGTSGTNGYQSTVDVSAFGNLKGSIASTGIARAQSLADVQASVNAGTVATVEAGSAVKGNVTAVQSATVTAWGDIQNATIRTGGDATVSAQGNAKTTIVSGGGVSLNASQTVEATIRASGDVSITGLGSIDCTSANSTNGSVTVFSGSTAAVQVVAAGTAAGKVQTVGVSALQQLSGFVQARNDVTLEAYQSINMLAASSQGSEHVAAATTIQGLYTAGQSLDVTAGGDITGAFAAGQGTVTIVGTGVVNGAVSSGSDASVLAKGDISGTVSSQTGSASLLSQGNVSATTTAATDANVQSLNGDVTGNVTAQAGSANVMAGPAAGYTDNAIQIGGGRVTGNVTAYVSANVTAFGQLSGNVTTTTGDASVTSFGNLTGAVTAGRDLGVAGFAAVSGAMSATRNAIVASLGNLTSSVHAGQDALVSALGAVSGNIDSVRDISVSSLSGDLDGSVHAGRDADVLVVGDSNGTVYAVGAVGIQSSGKVAGGVTAGDSVSINALGDVSADVSSTAGSVSVSSLGKVSGTVNAGQDVHVDAASDITGTVTAGNDADVETLGGLAATVSAGHDLTVSAVTSILQSLSAGRNATVIDMSDLLTDVQGTTGTVSVTVLGNFNGTIQSGSDTTLGVKGEVNTTINAGRNVSFMGNGVSNVMIAAGGFATVFSMGALNGSVNASGAASVTSPGDVTMNVVVTGGGDATVVAGGDLHGSVTADHDAVATAFGDLSLDVSATHDASVAALGDIHGLTLTATIGNATAFAFGMIEGGQVTAGQDANVSARGAVGGLLIDGHSVTVETLGYATGLTVNSGQDITVGSLDFLSESTLSGGRSMFVKTIGKIINTSFVAGQDANVMSYDEIDLATVNAHRNAYVGAVGDLKADVTAGGDVSIISFGAMDATVDAATISKVWSQGDLHGHPPCRHHRRSDQLRLDRRDHLGDFAGRRPSARRRRRHDHGDRADRDRLGRRRGGRDADRSRHRGNDRA